MQTCEGKFCGVCLRNSKKGGVARVEWVRGSIVEAGDKKVLFFFFFMSKI